MKNIAFLVLVSMLCYSLNGAQNDDKRREFGAVAFNCLLEVPGAMEKLKTFVGNNKQVVESNSLGFIQDVTSRLDRRIFTALDATIQILPPGHVNAAGTTQQKSEDEGVADLFRLYLAQKQTDFLLLKFIQYAYGKHEISVDEYRLDPDKPRSIGNEIDRRSREDLVVALVRTIKPKRRAPDFTQKFMKVVYACLTEKEPVQVVKDFVAGHNGAALLDTSGPDMPVPLGIFLEFLSPALFPMRDSLVAALNPDHKIPKSALDELPPVLLLQMGLREYILTKGTGLPLELLGYAYAKHPFCVDDLLLNSKKGPDGAEGFQKNGRMFGMAIDEAGIANEPWVEGLFELVRPNRLDKKQFFTLLDGCLIEKVSLRELRTFISEHNGGALLLQRRRENGRMLSVADYLESKNPLLFKKRNEIRKAFDPNYTPPVVEEAQLANLKTEAQEEVALALRRYLESKGDNGEIVTFMYTQIPLSLDAFPFNKRSTLGQELDRVKDTAYGKQLALLVEKKRWVRASADLDRKAFSQLLIQGLIDLDIHTERQLEHYAGDPILRAAQLPGILLGNSAVGFTLDENELKVDTFFELLNPALFPHKEGVRRSLGLRVKGAVEYTQKSDREFIENLLRSSLTTQELRPLLAYAFRNYEKEYGVQADPAESIDLSLVTYSGQSVKSYLAQQGSDEDTDFYENLFYTGAPQKVPSDGSQVKNKGTVAFWRKALGIGIAGAALYACYSYYPSKKAGSAAKTAPVAAA